MEIQNQMGSGQQPQMSPTNQSNWFDKAHIITYIIVIVFLATIGYGIAELSKTTKNNEPLNNASDQIGNYKTFNSSLGYSVTYPSDWSVAQEEKDSWLLPPNSDNMTIYFKVRIEDLSLDEVRQLLKIPVGGQ